MVLCLAEMGPQNGPIGRDAQQSEAEECHLAFRLSHNGGAAAEHCPSQRARWAQQGVAAGRRGSARRGAGGARQPRQGYLETGVDILGSLSDMHGLCWSLRKWQQGMLHRHQLRGGAAQPLVSRKA